MKKYKMTRRNTVKTRSKIKHIKSHRLSVHRTPRHIYAQIFSFDGSNVLVSVSTLENSIKRNCQQTGNKKAAEIVGKEVAKRAIAAGIKKVSFDRSGFKYHGRVQSLADAAREAGLEF